MWHVHRNAFLQHRMRYRSIYTKLPDALRQRVQKTPLAATYDPLVVENGWQEWWETQLASPTKSSKTQPKFTMLLPPPNITGALHIGHALTVTIQDALARWHRMKGYDVLWIPGLDHAGIATQSVVEKKIMKESGKTRHDLGREAFVQEVLQWNEQYGSRILNQLGRMGALLNKDKTFFTLDKERYDDSRFTFTKL